MLNDNFEKQMQWENSVLGPDDKKAEMAKMARANAMAKAAAEKAAAEKAVAERNAAKEEAKQQRTPATKTAAPVLIATPVDESAGKSTRGNDKFAEQPAPPPPAPVKPADDKFIDKILKGEASKKKVVRNDDALNELLAKEKIAPPPKPRGKRADNVDDLLRSAEKEPDMPAPKAKTPDWAKVEPETTPRPVAVIPRPQPKKDDGVIHIVQGAAGTMSAPPPAPRSQVAAASTARRPQNTDTFERRDSDPFAEAPRKRTAGGAAARSASFADPFADNGASPPAPRARSFAAPRPVAPPPAPRALPPPPARREAAAPPPGWTDPFADAPSDRSKPVKRTAEPKRAAPAGHPPGWKDPFSDAAPAHGSRSLVALTGRMSGGTPGDTRHHRGPSRATASGSGSSSWGVLKKQSRR
ncbi:MAG TPA: hypothetical protein VFH68_00185 [Polyangia bacterium]|nr:hypothetical protein [Polyangia bacterium]